MYKVIDKADKAAQLEESTINFILHMENPDYKDPEPCTGLTCPLTGEQYYVDKTVKEKKKKHKSKSKCKARELFFLILP